MTTRTDQRILTSIQRQAERIARRLCLRRGLTEQEAREAAHRLVPPASLTDPLAYRKWLPQGSARKDVVRAAVADRLRRMGGERP